jgi:hypothetical protein
VGNLLLTDNQNCCTGFFEAVSLQTAARPRPIVVYP